MIILSCARALALAWRDTRHLVIVGEAADGLEAVAKAKALLPDIVLLDIDMPNMSGLAVTEVLRKDLPQVKVLILSMHQRSEYLVRILNRARGATC